MPVKVSVKDGKISYYTTVGRGLESLNEVGLVYETDWTLSKRQRVHFGASPQAWEQYSRAGRIWDLSIVSR